ncbi:MAG: flagellar filament capping protein FliD [Bacillota bacterium]
MSSVSGNTLRLTGLATGVDTDEMVKALTLTEQTRIDNVKKEIQLLEWKQEAYRSVTTLLQEFQNTYFNSLKSSTNMLSSSTLSAFKVTFDGADTSSVLTAKAGAGAIAGNYTLSNIVLAEKAKATGTAISGGIQGSTIASFANITSSNDNNKINVTFNGITKEITVSDSPADINALVTDIQGQIDSLYGTYSGTSKIVVGNVGNQLTFTTDSTNILSFDYAYNTGYSELLGKDLSSGITLTSQNNKFKVTLDGTSYDIALTEGTYADTDAVIQEMQAKLDAAVGSDTIRAVNQNNTIVLKAVDNTVSTSATGNLATTDISSGVTIDGTNETMDITVGAETYSITLEQKTYTETALLSAVQSKVDSAFGSGNVVVSMDSSTGQLRFEKADSSATLSSSKMENGGLAALGLENVNQSNKVNLNGNLADIGDNFATALVPGAPDVDGYDIKFTINGETFKFKSAETTLNNIISTVNGNSNANVTMSYDQLNDRMIVQSKDTGSSQKVDIDDVSGNLMGALGLNGALDYGGDASMGFNDGSGVQTIVRDTNSFTVNGITFDLKTASAGPVELNVAADSSDAVALIKGFVEKYNEVIDKINDLLTEERDRDYGPLTDDEKEEMSESEIEKWETKAKSGILRSDSTLSSIVNSMRSALYSSVDGVSIRLFDIGITTSTSYSDKGKLVIDEDKLKKALEENGDEITQLFTKTSSYSYTDTANRTNRYNEEGLMQKINDILQDNIRSTSINGTKGTLLEKAGIKNSVTEYTNLISKQINDKNDRLDTLLDLLTDREDYWYARFAKMETAIQQMNDQASWLSSMSLSS